VTPNLKLVRELFGAVNLAKLSCSLDLTIMSDNPLSWNPHNVLITGGIFNNTTTITKDEGTYFTCTKPYAALIEENI